MKLSTLKLLTAIAVVSTGVAAYNMSSSRRSFLAKGATTAATVAVATGGVKVIVIVIHMKIMSTMTLYIPTQS